MTHDDKTKEQLIEELERLGNRCQHIVHKPCCQDIV